MNRASPADLRKALDVVDVYLKAGLLFVPMPVMDADDHRALIGQAESRLEQLAQQQERDQGPTLGDMTVYAVAVPHA